MTELKLSSETTETISVFAEELNDSIRRRGDLDFVLNLEIVFAIDSTFFFLFIKLLLLLLFTYYFTKCACCFIFIFYFTFVLHCPFLFYYHRYFSWKSFTKLFKKKYMNFFFSKLQRFIWLLLRFLCLFAILTTTTPTSFAMEEKELVKTVGEREHEFFTGVTLAHVLRYWNLPSTAGVLFNSRNEIEEAIAAGDGPYLLDIDPSVFSKGTP